MTIQTSPLPTLKNFSKANHSSQKFLSELKKMCLLFDPFQESDRIKMIDLLKDWGIDLQGADPFSLSNQILLMIDQEEQKLATLPTKARLPSKKKSSKKRSPPRS